MHPYSTVLRQRHIFVGGTADPAFSGPYEGDQPCRGQNESNTKFKLRQAGLKAASWYASKYKENTLGAHFTVALQGKHAGNPMSHFHISLQLDHGNSSVNAHIYYQYDRGKLYGSAEQMRREDDEYEIGDIFVGSFADSVDRMALEFFNKMAAPDTLLTEVQSNRGIDIFDRRRYNSNKQSVGDVDHSQAFLALFGPN